MQAYHVVHSSRNQLFSAEMERPCPVLRSEFRGLRWYYAEGRADDRGIMHLAAKRGGAAIHPLHGEGRSDSPDVLTVHASAP